MKINIHAYLRGEADPTTTAWLDQMFAACDELRNQAGIESDRKVPWPRAFDLMTNMWGRLLRESFDAGRHCEHIDRACPQPTWIVPDLKQAFCAHCAAATGWNETPWNTSAKEVRALVCDCCGEHKFKRRADAWDAILQYLHFAAPLRLCFGCRSILFYDRDHFYNPPEDGDGDG